MPTASPTAVRAYRVETVASELELGSHRVRTFTYNGQLPGPELRVREGEALRVVVDNRLPEPTTIHWHGIPVPNAMDGVPGVTQPAIAPGTQFTYEFVVPVAGTYFYHTHVGLQLDRGLYGALIVEPRQETLSYDREVTLVLDDWLDGIAGTPEDALQQLMRGGHDAHGMGHGTMPMVPRMGTMPGMTIGSLQEHTPDLIYPLYLINGRPVDAPFTFAGKRGELLRLRLINAASATIFRVALVGHRLRLVQVDGQPIEPLEGDALRIGMGERYDVLVQLNNPGVWPLVAWAEGTDVTALAVLRYEGSSGSLSPVTTRPSELAGELLHGLRVRSANAGSTPFAPDIELPIVLSGGMGQYVWTIDGQAYPNAEPIRVKLGQRVRFRLQNMTTMPHPMHLHGHFFRVGPAPQGALRDTVLIDPMQEVTIDWVADNPGHWAFHCHHLYHQETGMMRIIEVS
ncbi:MAG: multicopper oxidase family protein [Thermomicrobium sp.]